MRNAAKDRCATFLATSLLMTSTLVQTGCDRAGSVSVAGMVVRDRKSVV